MMTRGQANQIVVGDKVENMFGVKYTVTDLKFTNDSDGNNAILVTLTNEVRTIKCNLETCNKI